MTDTWAGITVSGNEVVVVSVVPLKGGALEVHSDNTLKLATGDRPDAYATMFRRIRDYIKENKITHVALKASAVSGRNATNAHLEAAELRGVVAAAVREGGANVHLARKASLSKTAGSKKVDEYLKDEPFWETKTTGRQLRIGSREAVFVIYGILKSNNDN
ncbi:hypothetical protein ACJ2CR_35490 [Myxococcus faecalis]|uniref:hypothetical protein n=1 Tax=Myxococcus faecalis TaxID=3115646 RepID=UPI0038D11917